MNSRWFTIKTWNSRRSSSLKQILSIQFVRSQIMILRCLKLLGRKWNRRLLFSGSILKSQNHRFSSNKAIWIIAATIIQLWIWIIPHAICNLVFLILLVILYLLKRKYHKNKKSKLQMWFSILSINCNKRGFRF